MARVISPHARYSLQVIEAPTKRGTDQSGNVVEYQEGKPVIAQFAQIGLQEWEQLAALEHFSFAGLAEGVNPLSTVSCWDSEAYCLSNGIELGSDLAKKIDAEVRRKAALHPASMLTIDKPESAAPWPTYDSMNIEEILATLQLTEIDPQVARIYETEHQDRPEVVALFERLLVGETLEVLLAELAPSAPGFPQTFTPSVAPVLPASPIVSGVASTLTGAPARTDPLAAARAAKKAKAEARAAEKVTVDA